MKKALKIFAVIAVCFAAGFGIGTIIIGCMNGKDEKKGSVGRSEIKVGDGILSPEVLLSLGRLSDPQLSPDGSLILYGVSYTSVEENRSCRNLFVCGPDGSGRKQISSYSKSVSCARWSNDGRSIYFLQGGQLWKAPFNGKRLGRKECLSDVPSGISEFAISPDGAQIMYVSSTKNPNVDQASDIDPELDKAQAYATENLMYRHWDHWVTETPRTFVSVLGAAKVTPDNSLDILYGEDPGYELPTEPFGGIEQLSWAPDGRHIAYSCRKLTGKEYAFSTNSCIYIYDILTGHTLEVTSKGGYDTCPSFSPDGSKLSWISMERDGYEADRQRLMVADITTVEVEDGQCFGLEVSNVRELTTGFKYDVASTVWTPDSRKIIFPSTMDAVGALCMADLDKDGVRRLTPEDWWYSFDAPFSVSEDGDRLTLLTSWNSIDFPTELVKVTVGSDGAEFCTITDENGHIFDQLDGIRCERIALPCSNGETLYSWVLYPAGFDATKTWHGIEMFNGGPQTSLDQAWSYRWNFRMMCQQGYVVVLPARHGDSGFGQAWKEQISGDYQGLNMEDYQIAGRWFKSQPWAGKLAGVGASYGGFSVYNMMGIHEDLYDCFISHAGIFDEKIMWYTTEEAWFGNWDNGGLKEYAYEPGKTGPAGDGMTFGGMQQAGAPYADVAKSKFHYANDPESKVTKWHTPILCMHGMMDFRIPYTQGMAAFNAAQMMGVPSRLVIFPEENHWILQPQNAMLWHKEFFGWLEKWLKSPEND